VAQNITTGAMALVEAAKREIKEYTVDEMVAMKDDDGIVMVDIRDPRELEREGRIDGAFHCPRGMLEFWIDPASPYHKPTFAEDKRRIWA
jgi:rhodanese-related sulfurtransferase